MYDQRPAETAEAKLCRKYDIGHSFWKSKVQQ